MIEVFYNATQSVAGTSIMIAVVIIIFLSACVGQVATSSRQMWSFARDRGVPGSTWLAQVPPGYNIPINAIVLSAIITSLLSLINLGKRNRPLSWKLCRLTPWFDRFVHGFQRLQLARHSLHPLLLHHNHRVPRLAAPARLTTASPSLVAGTLWAADQHRIAVFHDADAVFLHMAGVLSRHCR